MRESIPTLIYSFFCAFALFIVTLAASLAAASLATASLAAASLAAASLATASLALFIVTAPALSCARAATRVPRKKTF